jgi:hypothetical protein
MKSNWQETPLLKGQVPPGTAKGQKVQHLGNITGRRTPGLTTVGGGDQLAHSMSHYGKDAPQLVDPFAVTGFPGPLGRRRR